jgi:glutamate--cysteine ligase
VYGILEQRLRRLADAGLSALLAGGQRGVEKESLRVDREGCIAMTPHPAALGSALTHPRITTDYSEALLELITGPDRQLSDTLDELTRIHAFVYRNLDDELLWATSMPCIIDAAAIPIADYGSSNIGTMKRVYRRGLAWRYGKAMQCIAGVHFNFSVAEDLWPEMARMERHQGSLRDFQDLRYFDLIRNFQRYGWLLPYLFGASPALCKSFMREQHPGFESLDSGTWYVPHATSLRMSDIGYKNAHQADLDICYNDLDRYVQRLTRAIETPSPEYAGYGVVVDDEWRQLNTNLLQIENEYYSFVRPKQIAESGEKPTLALKRRGVRYVEIRALDIGTFDPLGVNSSQLSFIEVLLNFCLLQASPQVSDDEQRQNEINQSRVATRGREPGITLCRGGEDVRLQDWGLELVEQLLPVAEAMDAADGGDERRRAIEWQAERLRDPDLTPSAISLATMRDAGEGFADFALRMSNEHRGWFMDHPLSDADEAAFAAQARSSREEQRALETADTQPFDRFMDDYFAQSLADDG